MATNELKKYFKRKYRPSKEIEEELEKDYSRTNSKGELSITVDVPIEEVVEEKKEERQEVVNLNNKIRRIEKEYDKPNSTLRRVADFVGVDLVTMQKPISYQKIADSCNITEIQAARAISKLNIFPIYPINFIPVKKKKGYIQGSCNNVPQTDRYLIRKSRTITTMTQVRDNVKSQVKVHKLKLREKEDESEMS